MNENEVLRGKIEAYSVDFYAACAELASHLPEEKANEILANYGIKHFYE